MSENSEIAVLKANYRKTNRSIKEAEANLEIIRAEYEATIKRHSAFYRSIERLRIQLAAENLKSRPQRSLIETLNRELDSLLKEQGIVKFEIDNLKRKKVALIEKFKLRKLN